MKKCLLLFCVLICVVLFGCALDEATAEAGEETAVLSGEQANLTWTLDQNGTLTVSGTGKMSKSDFEASYSWEKNDRLIKNVIINEGVTDIGEYAFANCASLQSITIPDSVTSIGDTAFLSCTSLQSVTIPDSVAEIGLCAFLECTSLQSVTIPDSVTSIGEGAFGMCTSLQSVTIPGSITDIEVDVFRGCTSLQSVIITDGLISIGEDAFLDCTSLTSVTIPDSVIHIDKTVFEQYGSTLEISGSLGSYAEQYCRENGISFIGERESTVKTKLVKWFEEKGGNRYGYLDDQGQLTVWGRGIVNLQGFKEDVKTVVIREGMTIVYGFAFENCTSLQSVIIPDSVTAIGGWAFSGCTSLRSVIIPDGVKTIGKYAFSGCTSLQSVNIPDGVIRLESNAFSGCTSLQSVNIPDSVTSIESFSGCTSLQSVNIPDSVTSIGNYAFSGCTSLQSVNIPDSVTSIGREAFSGCILFQNIMIPGSVSRIGSEAFSDCSSLKNVVIQDGVTAIEGGAFNECPLLITISIPDSVTEIESLPFILSTPTFGVTYPDGTFVSSRLLTAIVGRGSYASQYFFESKSINYKEIRFVPTEEAGLSISSKDGAVGLSAGKTLQMTAAFDHPEMISKKEQNDAVIWSVVNAETGGIVPAVTITEGGQLKADKKLDETVRLLVTCESAVFGTRATAVVTAMPLVKKVLVEPAELFFYVGTEEPQTVKAMLEPASVPPVGLTWTPAKKDLVEITETGDGVVSIKALGAGKTTVAVKEPGGKNAKLTVNVVAPVEAVELTVKGKVKAGGKVNIMPALSPKNAGNKAVQWSLDVGEDIAAINEKGQLTISKNAPSGTRITVTCTAEGAPTPVTASVVIEVP